MSPATFNYLIQEIADLMDRLESNPLNMSAHANLQLCVYKLFAIPAEEVFK